MGLRIEIGVRAVSLNLTLSYQTSTTLNFATAPIATPLESEERIDLPQRKAQTFHGFVEVCHPVLSGVADAEWEERTRSRVRAVGHLTRARLCVSSRLGSNLASKSDAHCCIS